MIDLLAASKVSRPKENGRPVVPKPTQTGGRGRGEIVNVLLFRK